MALPGHKGLYGPQGTGLLLCGAEGKPLLYGGTGSMSRLQDMPPDLPDRLEPRERHIISLRFGLDGAREQTQKEVADRLGISQSYISRLEKKIMNRLRKDLVRYG